MSEKRFVIPKGLRVIRNTETGEEALFYDTEDGLLLEKWLNEQHEENEQLKQDKVRLTVLLHSLQDRYSGLLRLVHGFDKND